MVHVGHLAPSMTGVLLFICDENGFNTESLRIIMKHMERDECEQTTRM